MRYSQRKSGPKIFGLAKKKTKDQETAIREEYGLDYRDAKRLHELVQNKNIARAIELFDSVSKLENLDSMSEGKKEKLLKKLSGMNI